MSRTERDARIEAAILEAYQGTEADVKSGLTEQPAARIFMWQDGKDVKLGTAPALAEFLGVSWGQVHMILRRHGYQLWSSPKVGRGEIVNDFVEPAKVEEIIGQVPEAPARARETILADIADAHSMIASLHTKLAALYGELS